MAWQDKTLEAKYTSPSGKEFMFHYEKVSRETNLKTGIFEFPDRDGAHVQHQGAGAKSFPLICIFSGPDCMGAADAFEESLFERDIGELRHPVYGTIKVIPTGYIKREDDLINALNESRVTVTFTETITADEATPMNIVSLDIIEAAYDDLLESSVLDFAENIAVDRVAEELMLQSMLTEQVQLLDENLISLVQSDASALAKYKTISEELKTEIRTLNSVGALNAASDMSDALKREENFTKKGLNAARLALNLMKLPSRIVVDLKEKINSYSIFAANIISQFRNDPFGIRNIANAFHSTGLVLSGCVASIASGTAFSIARAASSTDRTVVNRTPNISPPSPSNTNPDIEIVSREESIQTVHNIISLLESIKAFQDSKIVNNKFIDSKSNSYHVLNKLVYSCIQLIINISLSLPMRRTIKLDQDRQIVELVCELYGSVDYIDKFISDNDISIDELEVIPMGREVTYHVQVT